MASTIGGFIALVAVGALKAVVDGAQVVNRSSETTSEIRFAARLLAHDLANLYRDLNPENMRLIGTSQGPDATGPAFLTFYTVGRAKARPDRPEGDVYEVEYLLGTRETGEAGDQAETVSQVLYRRLWPNPDLNRSPGGVVTPIAENLAAFEIRFFDGKQWGGEWTEEMKSLPKLIEVTLAAQAPGRGEPVVETFIASFPRLTEGTEVPAGAEEAAPSEPQEAQPQQPGAEPTGGQNPSGNSGNTGSPPRQPPRKR